MLNPLFTNVGEGFLARVGAAIPIEAEVIDDCGSRLQSGSVLASFSNGDPGIALRRLSAGRWSGNWIPENDMRALVDVTLKATDINRRIEGLTIISGSVTLVQISLSAEG